MIDVTDVPIIDVDSVSEPAIDIIHTDDPKTGDPLLILLLYLIRI